MTTVTGRENSMPSPSFAVHVTSVPADALRSGHFRSDTSPPIQGSGLYLDSARPATRVPLSAYWPSTVTVLNLSSPVVDSVPLIA